MRPAIIANLEKEGVIEAVAGVVTRLTALGGEYLVERQLAEMLHTSGFAVADEHVRSADACVEEGDILVAFGGDGTILGAARRVGARGTPIIGVNLGKLGFLAELAPEELPEVLDDIIAGKFLVQERLVLQARTPSKPGTVITAVNDIVVDKSRSSRLIDVHAHIDGAFAVTYRGDGLIVSTPTGSTGYALSNNGPIVIPTCAVIGITPISPHTLNGRPLIVPDTSVIRIVVHSDQGEVLLSADGQEEAFVTPPLEVTIERAPYLLRLVKRVDRSYFDVLRAKLFWGADARIVEKRG